MDTSTNFEDHSYDHPITKEYVDFMKWFKENHPDLHKKYGKNIKVPFKIDGGVGVSSDFKISQEEKDMLFKVAQKYYHPDK